MKKHLLGENQHYVAGKRGIRFQKHDGVMESRKPGEPVPEATGFKNIRVLVSSGRLRVEDMPSSSKKSNSIKDDHSKDQSGKKEDERPRKFFPQKKKKSSEK